MYRWSCWRRSRVIIDLRVRIELTPEQEQAWCREYGIEPAELRADVRRYVETGLQNATGLNVEQGCAESVTVS
jgi:hypothetical protein